jgi:hypothetical protein
LPRVGALDQLRGGARKVGELPSRAGDGLGRVRDNPGLAVAIAGGGVLLLAWIAWAVYVTSSNGAMAGLGVVIAWPALLAALGLISLPFVGGYLLIRRLNLDRDAAAGAGEDEHADEESEEDDGSEEEEEAAEEEDEETEAAAN